MGPAMMAWMKGIQTRVSTTSSIISSMKEVKMLGTSSTWLETVQDLRIHELDLSKKFRMLTVYMNLLGNTPSLLAPVFTFGLAILAGHHGGADQALSISTVFTSMAIIDLVVGPLARLLFAVPSFMSSIGCFKRIQDFLDKADQKQPARAEADVASTAPPGNGCMRGEDEIELPEVPSHNFDAREALLDAQNVSMALKSEAKTEEPKPILQDISIRVMPTSLTIIAGKVGSGKSILLRGLLGELQSEGRLRTSPTGAAYCGQTAWLVNASIKHNIIGQNSLDHEWLDTVVHACDLHQDLHQLPAGHETVVGSKGLSLSGGQKQRVVGLQIEFHHEPSGMLSLTTPFMQALARALYSRKPLLIIDDVFSGLDRTTQRRVWNRVFGPIGLLRRQGSTAVLATQYLEHLNQSDHIVVLDGDGRIACQGPLSKVNDNTCLKDLLIHENCAKNEDVRVDTHKSTGEPERNKGVVAQNENPSDEQDLLRSGGDVSLYTYYLKSVGWRYGALALVLGIAGTFFHIFPGTPNSRSPSLRSIRRPIALK